MTTHALYRRDDPVTSRDAAIRADSFRASHEIAILSAIIEAGPDALNYREIARMADMDPVAVARRLSSMEARGAIERRLKPDSIKPRDYVSRNGCALWYLKSRF